MTAWSAAGGESLLAHGIHYALLVGGVGGLGVLLLPQMFARSSVPAEPRNDFERRIQILRANVAEGSMLTGAPTGTLILLAPTRSTRPNADTRDAGQRDAGQRDAGQLDAGQLDAGPLDAGTRIVLPLALVSSLAAAGVHAAVGPAHFAEGTPIGLFFAICSLLQLLWVGLVMLRPRTLLFLAGAIGNLSVISLWATTRTVGFPGVLPGPEAVGSWDAACGLWELTVAVSCLLLLRAGLRPRVRGWTDWHPGARGWLVGSVLLLGLLSVSGASA